jgi:hypothetical protein
VDEFDPPKSDFKLFPKNVVGNLASGGTLRAGRWLASAYPP